MAGAGGHRGEHPTAALLHRFLRGELAPREAAPIVAHLLPGCDLCQEGMTPLATVMFRRSPLPDPAPGSGTEYDFPLFRALASARRHAEAVDRELLERRTEPAGFLREVPPPLPLTQAGRNARDRERCAAFLEASRALRGSDPEGMVLLARLAVTLAERLLPEEPSAAPPLADLQAQAWAELGNARRVSDDLPGAEADLARALDRAGRGSGDPLLLARIMDFTASLYTDQRRFAEAFELLDCAHAIYRAQGDDHAAGRALISKGMSAGYALSPGEALRLISQGLRSLDARRDPVLVLMGVHNLIFFLVDVSRLQEARKLIELSRDLYAACGEPLLRLKGRWAEGRIAAGLGQDAAAEEAFLEARNGFAEAGLHYDAALAALELAAVWLRQGRFREIRELVDQTVAIFRTRKIRREALAALLMLREACARERATAAMLQAVAGELASVETGRRT